MKDILKLIGAVSAKIGDSLESRIAKNQIQVLKRGVSFCWFDPPDTLKPNAVHRHNGSYIIICNVADGSNLLIQAVKSDYYKGTFFRVKTSSGTASTDTTIKRLSDDEIEEIWEAINNSGLEKKCNPTLKTQ